MILFEVDRCFPSKEHTKIDKVIRMGPVLVHFEIDVSMTTSRTSISRKGKGISPLEYL